MTRHRLELPSARGTSRWLIGIRRLYSIPSPPACAPCSNSPMCNCWSCGYLDHQVDQILERSYQLLSRRAGWRAIAFSIPTEERRQLSALQVDSAILLERVTNALKFLGEEYLARLYRLAAGRLHLSEWDGVITRKLATVENIYQKLTDRVTARRMELLEWVIILLIAFEIVLSLWR